MSLNCTTPSPSGVSIFEPTFGIYDNISLYTGSSYAKQHIILPHAPPVLVGDSDIFCVFAILTTTCSGSFKNDVQQHGLPHSPNAPTDFTSSLILI